MRSARASRVAESSARGNRLTPQSAGAARRRRTRFRPARGPGRLASRSLPRPARSSSSTTTGRGRRSVRISSRMRSASCALGHLAAVPRPSPASETSPHWCRRRCPRPRRPRRSPQSRRRPCASSLARPFSMRFSVSAANPTISCPGLRRRTTSARMSSVGASSSVSGPVRFSFCSDTLHRPIVGHCRGLDHQRGFAHARRAPRSASRPRSSPSPVRSAPADAAPTAR